ncbi:MAG: hypothetical protein KKD38_02230, partial [Candidatus Delongbacteria bacterium]|nr:hypothetical protein [Candidatus Delongbacteria bacterium]MCG2760726.1 hypothetical protein [Candidatus Delongbacteria bacterium]
MATNVMRYPIEYKVEVCECAKNMSVSSAAVIYSLHRSTVNNWLLKYNKSGVNGFVVKRNDTQSAKLDYETLAEIQNFKKYNPKATLRDIKDKFDLDCNISLISRKLNVNPILNKSNKKNCELFLKLHIIKKAVFRNEVRTIYRLSLNTSEGKIIAIGYTKNYTSMNICLFIRHSLASINKSCKKWNVRRIETNIFCIRKNDFDSIVKSRYLTDLKLTSKKKGKKYSSYKHISLPKDINCAIEDTYDRILNNFNSDIIDSSLLTSVYNLDVIKKESVDPKNWSAVPIPNENKKSLLTVLGRIKQTGDHAARNFDYKKAHAEYDKVYKILSDLQFEDKQTVCSILLSKALMYYDREKEQTALMLFSDSLNYAEKNGFEKEMAESCFYIGKINSKFSDYKNAIKYYQKSSDILEGKDSPECLCMYYRVQYMIQIANKNYSNADKISALYLINALRTN